MRYIKNFENFRPIKINSHKPFKVKKNLDRSIKYLQTGIKSINKRLDSSNGLSNKKKINRIKLVKDRNNKVKQLSDLTFKQIKQAEYLKNNIDENLDSSKDLIDVLESENFDSNHILDYLGLDEDEYKIAQYYSYYESPIYDINGITLLTTSKYLEFLMGIEENSINFVYSFTNYYNQYEYYVDDDELNYLENYLTTENEKQTIELAKIFGIKLSTDGNRLQEGQFYKLFDKLGLYYKLNNYKGEISMENERAVEKAAKKVISELPFKIDFINKKDYDIEIEIVYDDVVKHIKENNLKDVKTIKDFLEKCVHEIGTDIEYDKKNQFLGDFKDLNREIENDLDDFITWPDGIFTNLIIENKLKLFKKKIELANFGHYYDIRVNYNNVRKNLFQLSEHYKNSIYNWFKTDEFEEMFMKMNTSKEAVENYHNFMLDQDIKSYNL
jgi:hypothetical protein